MSESMFPDVRLAEGGLHLLGGDFSSFIPAEWIEASPALRAENGYFHRVTLTLFVNDIHIESGVDFQ